MSKTVINKRSQIIWDNGFAPDGQSLPKVSTTDAGKVLTVDEEGKWSAGEASGGTEYTAGDNIQISADNVISATDTTYTAGTGISISAGNVISADSQLPSVTSADEGKVLKVDSNGDWAVGTDDDTKYTAGTNVQINGSVISATDTTYTAGANVSISAGNVISATDTTYTAGTNVQITNGVISATDTTYTAGNGITITGTSIAADAQLPEVTSSDEGNVLTVDSQGNWVPDAVPKELPTVSSADEGKILTVDNNGNWVKGANDAGMVKAAIADDYVAAMPFYPVYSDAITGTGNMTRDCFVGQAVTGWTNVTGGARPYTTSSVPIYMAIYKTNENQYKIALFTTNTSALFSGEAQVQWINLDGTVSNSQSAYVTEAFTGTVNSGYYTNDASAVNIASHGLISDAALVECDKDISLCVYNSLQDAVDAFGAWTIGGGSYAEGDQVWKDGKLQTYTSGAWVDSDPIVEQIANAGGGSTGETLTLIDSTTKSTAKTETWSGSATLASFNNIDLGTYSKIVVAITPDTTSNTNTQYLLRSNYTKGFYLEARKIGNDYIFNPVYMGKYSNFASNASYSVTCAFDAFVSGSELIVTARSDSLSGSIQPYLFIYNNAIITVYGIS